MTEEKTAPESSELRFLADNFEQAQRLRIAVGERIRAVLQSRDETFVTAERIETALDQTVERYLRIKTTGTFNPCTFAIMVKRYASASRELIGAA